MKADKNRLNQHLYTFIKAQHPSDYAKTISSEPLIGAISH